MKSTALFVVLTFFILTPVFAAKDCTEASDGMAINQSVVFCSDTYDVPNGIRIIADNVVLDCGTAVLRGFFESSESGIRAENVRNITIKKCNIVTFNIGILLKNVTNSRIVDNALLKNDIGIRLMESYENIIEKNSDKSNVKAVSAVNSKFNIVMLGNKPVEQGFCEVNVCNEYGDINPCVSGDFYCSAKCNAENDNDCGPAKPVEPVGPVEKQSKEQEKALEERAGLELEQGEGVVENRTSPTSLEERLPAKRVPLWQKIFIFIATYFVGFVAVQFYIYKNQ